VKYLLLLLLITNVYAENEFEFFSEKPVINLNTLREDAPVKEIKNKKAFVEKYNNYDTYGFGARRDGWEKSRGVLQYKGSIDLFYRRDFILGDYTRADFEFSVNTISPIAKQGIYFGTNNGSDSMLGVKLQTGQLFAIEEHTNSGYLFVNYGLAGKIRLMDIIAWEFFIYTPSSYTEVGSENKFWVDNSESYGFYLNFESYRPLDLETRFEGQTNYRFGVIFRY
jgi:hypothetical protein